METLSPSSAERKYKEWSVAEKDDTGELYVITGPLEVLCHKSHRKPFRNHSVFGCHLLRWFRHF